jgi:thiamine biosynthesis lipoprotein
MIVRRASWQSIGTKVDLLVVGGDVRAAKQAVAEQLQAADAAFSRFRSDSELRRIQASHVRTRVSPLLAAAIEAALRGARLTDGLVDPTVGRVMRLTGYDRDFPLLASGDDMAPVFVAEPVAGWRAISWDTQTSELRIPEDVELDFGSTGKALIADLGAPLALKASEARGILLSIGGDLATAGEPPAGGWRIAMSENSLTAPDSVDDIAVIQGGALATSSTTVRRWLGGQTVVHHIIDPRTGRPASGPWRTASVVAASCVDANICATAAIVSGSDAIGWLDRQRVSARLVARDGQVQTTGGWPPSEDASAADSTAAPDRAPASPVLPHPALV